MPYCLQDFTVKCKSEKNGFDYECKRCSAGCFQNWASELLKSKHIEPYIWMEGNMKGLSEYTLKENRTFGVLGIAMDTRTDMGASGTAEQIISRLSEFL